MPRRSDSRNRIIRSAAKLLRRQGYAATGWRQVIAESGAPWGSQAHYFPGGKQQLATEAIAHAGTAYEAMLRAALSSAHPAEAVAAWADLAAAQLEASGWVDGCPVATVTLEEAASSDLLAVACHDAFSRWRAELADSFAAHAIEASEVDSLAILVLAAIEGGLLLSRAARDQGPLRIVGAELAKDLRHRLDPVGT
jgi:TetR/AcrR family transcriptional repressor of lmrAB and yxaGH operons